MSKLSFFDKIGILLETTASSNLFIIACLLFIVLGLVLSTTNKKNEKRNKTFYIAYIVFILVFILVSFYSSLGKMFSYMMNNFFIVVYFPNLAVYLAAIIITNIVLLISIFNYKITKAIKNLNIIIFTIMNFLFILVLNVINSNNLDIFSKESVYKNRQAQGLIELSSTIFIVWIIFLIIYRIILIYLKKEYRPKVKKVIVRKKVKKLPENYQPLDTPDYVYGSIPKKVAVNDNLLLKEFESKFTLEEYKLFSKILKEHKLNKDNSLDQEKEEVKKELSKIDIVDDSENFKDDFREMQKKEIIKMEEERRELLKLAEQKKQEEQELEQAEKEREVEPIQDNRIQIEDSNIFKDENDYEIEDREQAKLTELERLYQSIR